jgi:hypothetical protein
VAASRVIAFGSATALVSAAALVIMQPKLPGIVTACAGTAFTLYAAQHVQRLSHTLTVTLFLLLGLVLLAWVAFLVDVGAHGGFN